MKHYILLILLTTSAFVYASGYFFNTPINKQTEQVTTPVKISFINSQLIIENAPINSHVEIFTMLGVSIFQGKTLELKHVFLVDLNKGYYIVKTAGETKKISVK